MSVTNQPIVIDNGSGVLKAGFAGDEMPQVYFPSYVGRPKHRKVMDGPYSSTEYVGNKAQELQGLLRIEYPIDHGVITNWDDMQRIWTYVYETELNVPYADHPVLLTEAPLNARRQREKAAEVFFETFNVPALFISLQSVLSLYASGRTTGIVLDSGDGVTHCVPIFAGFALPHSIVRIDVGGRDITNSLVKQLREAGYNFHTSAEREVVKGIKERQCFVRPTLDDEATTSAADRGGDLQSYTLPDGTIIELGPERHRAPELLFNPSLIGLEYEGVQHCVASAIARSDLDLRATLYSNIVLSGGSTMFKGFPERLLYEVRSISKNVKVKIHAPEKRKFTTWSGGSILASLATFKQMWVSLDEYRDAGPSAIHARTL